MGEDIEKIVALKQACGDIILNTAKEAAARVLAAERKAFQLQRSLAIAKDESLALLLRLKAVMESKIKEAEKVNLSQARKIRYLEIQLCEAKDMIGSLRSEMKKVNSRLKIRRNHPTAILNKENGGAKCVLNSGLTQAASYQRDKSGKCCFIKDRKSVDIAAVNPDLSSIILENKEPNHYLSECTQKNCVFEENVLNEKELPTQSHGEFSKIDAEIIKHQTAYNTTVLDSAATGKTISMMPIETKEVGLLDNASGNGNALRFCKQYGRRKVLGKESTQPIAEASRITGNSISPVSMHLESKEVGSLNDICGNHVHGVHDPSIKWMRKFIVEHGVGNSTINGRTINVVSMPCESKEVDQVNIFGSDKVHGLPDGNGRQRRQRKQNGRQRRQRKHIMKQSVENFAVRDRTFCLVNMPFKSKRVGGKLHGNGDNLRFWSRYGRPRMQRKHIMKPMGFGTSEKIVSHESSDDNSKKDEPGDMNHVTTSSENTHTATSEAPQETLITHLENAETSKKERIKLRESLNHQILELPASKRIMTEEIVMKLCNTSSKSQISSSIITSKNTGEGDNQSKPLAESTGSMIDDSPADKDAKHDSSSEKTVESKFIASNCEIVENLLTSQPTGNHEVDILMGNTIPGDEGEADRTAHPAEVASSRTTSCVIKYTYHKKRKRACLDNKNETVYLGENSASLWKVPKKSTLVNAQKSDFLVDSSSRQSRRLAQVARQLISLSEKRW